METLNGIEIVPFDSADMWDAWLAKDYQRQEGVWMKIAKKSSGIPTVSHAEALDVALCYGWIDGQGKPYQDPYYLQKFTPRRPKSMWSRINVEKVASLIAAGRMQPSGFAAIEAAKSDGRWDAAYESQKIATVPSDFAMVLDQNSLAKDFFESLNKANRYSFIWRITTAKNPELRQQRIEKFVRMLEEGKKFH
jgi:uncharacterized protein YdeI (YjbR/CyaY-like superfamily)